MKAQIFIKRWEQENGLLLIELQQRFKRGLWQLIKLKTNALKLALFLIYLMLQWALKFLVLTVGLLGRHELKFHRGPENPSLVASEFHADLRRKTGPNVFFR